MKSVLPPCPYWPLLLRSGCLNAAPDAGLLPLDVLLNAAKQAPAVPPVPTDAMRSRLDGYGCQRLPTADNRFQCHLITRYGRKTGGEVRSVQTVVLQQQKNGAWQPIAP